MATVTIVNNVAIFFIIIVWLFGCKIYYFFQSFVIYTS